MIYLNFFPILYSDELLYSAIARYCIRSGNTRIVHNLEDLFGTRCCIATMELPTNLDALTQNMPVGTKYTSEYFIDNHTLFPFYAAFVPPERSEQIKTTMKNGEGAVSYIRMGLLSTSIQLNTHLRFCPECLKEDVSLSGEAYWHRLHQVSGVMVCSKHGLPIYNSTELVRGGNRQKYIHASRENCIVTESIDYSYAQMEKMISIANDAEALLNSKFGFRQQEWFKNQFRVKLIDAGYARMNNFIHQKKLKKDFLDFYGHAFLELMQSKVNLNGECWLSNIIRDNTRVTHPIRYLLVARFLQIPLIDLFNKEFKTPDTIIDSYSNNKEAYNKLWEERLKELISMDLSIREIATILESTPKTVRRRIDKLGIAPFWKNNGGGQFVYKEYKDTERFLEKREASRVKWLKHLEENTDKSSNKIRKSNEGLYSWLTKYDKEWLRDNCRKMNNISPMVDWEKRDEELLDKVKVVVEEMCIGKPQRICWSTIGGKLGVSGWLSKRKDKLPITKAYIESVMESITDFQVRKVEWAIDELEKQGKEFTKWNLIEMSGVKQRYFHSIIYHCKGTLAQFLINLDTIDR